MRRQISMRTHVAGANGEVAHTSPRRKQKKPTPKKAAGAQRAQRSMVVEQFAPSSVAGVVQESGALKGALVYFVPSYSPARHSKADLEAMVARLGGKVLPVDASVVIVCSLAQALMPTTCNLQRSATLHGANSC